MLKEIQAAGESGKLLKSTVKNLQEWLTGNVLPKWAIASIGELVEAGAWDELNDRFYKYLEFGTGGMRNRTISKVLTRAERGNSGEGETPAYAAVGSAMLNDFNIVRATIGLFRYCKRYLDQCHLQPANPRLIIAHDVRHFSKHFSELTASTWTKLGGFAMVFDGPRSTPQLSYSVRKTKATAGIVITASHNPFHDNGYKVYFQDGAQVIYPHAEGIIHEVYQVSLEEVVRYLDVDTSAVTVLSEDLDEAYLAAIDENILDATVLAEAKPKVVFSPIHGVAGFMVQKVLQRHQIDAHYVDEQMVQSPAFPTVKSPNPENAEALNMALQLADTVQAEVVLATDPDSDRMGVAVRGDDGKMMLLSGNLIGSLLADYRIRKMKELGILPQQGTQSAALVKTFVTTPLQATIARQNGLKVIDTLTGFKWIGAKLLGYEQHLKQVLLEQDGIAIDYDSCTLAKRRELLLKHSTFYVFGGEESYGYMGVDSVRDKDANAAVLMFCELAADLKGKGISFAEHIDSVYLRYGYNTEGVLNLYYEGASGAAKINAILKSYRDDTPKAFGEIQVTAFKDFGTEDIYDEDDELIPKQDFYFLELDNGYSFAVRGSGTEPKIKFYIFAQEDVAQPGDLEQAKAKAKQNLAELQTLIEQDARKRAES